ncbi:F-box only protein 39-like [Physella acuta]|uniref:F-box only protein 39-like n=1 Tax=Physella acuta TaxID=109671 RepID=UPI0027DE3FAB|nr:F-box only protein 39-like [Physella acuta]
MAFYLSSLKQAAVDFVMGGTTQPDWSQLPNEILLHVFSYLSNSDKYHAALTCKSWLRPLSVPTLWQSGDFVFDDKSDEKAIRFVEIAGKTLRHIKAECKKLENLQLVLEYRPSSSEKMYLFLASLLNSENHQLLTFRLKNMNSLETYCGGAERMPLSEVTKLLKRFLKAQRQLRVLDLSNSEKSVRFCFEDDSITVRQGMKLLIAAGKHCATTLHTLAIARLVSLKSSFHNSMSYLPQFRNAISGFSKLSELDLSYGYLEDDLLLSLAANTNTSLKVITVRADEIPKLESRITPLAWEKLTAACPELKAIFHIKHKYESYSQDPTLILTPSMPLYQVKWKAGDAIAIENLEKFFQHVAQNFQNTLHHLHVKSGVRPDTERFELVFKSLQACKNLETLSLCLKSCKSGDVEMYMLAIKDVMTRCPVSCDVTLNGQVVKVGSGEFTGLTS